jgi:hypothetical protein
MSDRLAIASTLSVLMMSVYVLFGHDAAHTPLGPDSGAGAIGVSVSTQLPSLPDLLPLVR